MASDRNRVLGGLAWKFAERTSSQAVSFVLSIILARLLMPKEYGLVAMINIFIVFANVFVTSGFTASLIQKKDADDLDFSTIFYCTFTISLLLYTIIYFFSPAIARFYNMPDLCLLTRVYALSLVITSYQTIQQAYISRHLLFKKTFVSTFIGTILSGVIGVVMAYNGYGVWALVAQFLSNIVINMVTLMFIIPWKPKLVFSMERAKILMRFGGGIFVSSLISKIYREIRQLIIGKMYTPADLGYYNRGMGIPHFVTNNIESTISSVLFPTMSDYSDNPERMKQILRRGIRTSSYILFFLFTLLATASKPLVILLLTEKWAPCIPYMQIFCISNMMLLISRCNVQAIKALGAGKEVIKLEVLKKPVFLLVILAVAKFGPLAIALTSPVNSLYAMAMNMRPTRKLLSYSSSEQLKDFVPATMMSIVVAATTLPFVLLKTNDFVILILQVFVGILTFILFSKVFKVESYSYIKTVVVDTIKKIRK